VLDIEGLSSSFLEYYQGRSSLWMRWFGKMLHKHTKFLMFYVQSCENIFQ